MLSLKRKIHEAVIIDHHGERMVFTIRPAKGNAVQIDFDGPRTFHIVRAELEVVERKEAS